MLETVQSRECNPATVGGSIAQIEMCRSEVDMEALALARDTNREADQTIQGLRDLFVGLRVIDAPKTLILISEGFVLSDEAHDHRARHAWPPRRAPASTRSSWTTRCSTCPIAACRSTRSAIVRRAAKGLELLAGASRGTLFTVTGTAEAPFFERIESELSGYYLLGVESDPRDRDGKAHPIRVDVPRRGAIVRSRRQMLNAPSDATGDAARRASRWSRR